MGNNWSVTHIYRGENYLVKGPFDKKGAPTECHWCFCDVIQNTR